MVRPRRRPPQQATINPRARPEGGSVPVSNHVATAFAVAHALLGSQPLAEPGARMFAAPSRGTTPGPQLQPCEPGGRSEALGEAWPTCDKVRFLRSPSVLRTQHSG